MKKIFWDLWKRYDEYDIDECKIQRSLDKINSSNSEIHYCMRCEITKNCNMFNEFVDWAVIIERQEKYE